jgi:hypothetical protein
MSAALIQPMQPQGGPHSSSYDNLILANYIMILSFRGTTARRTDGRYHRPDADGM